MARPRLPITRDAQFNVSLTADELAALHHAARIARLRPVEYGRAMLLKRRFSARRVAQATPHLDPLLVLELSRLGNNLNQIARQLHALTLPVPEELPPLLAEIRMVLKAALKS